MSKYSAELKAQVVKEAKETGNATMVARRHQVPAATVYSWIRGRDLKANTANVENRKLRKALEEKELENEILKELLKKTNQAWLTDSP